jgi:Nidogen-like
MVNRRSLRRGLGSALPVFMVIASGFLFAAPADAAAVASGAVVGASGCEANVLPANDDGSTGEIQLPFELDFFGSRYHSLWVNNNGNVTFTGPMSTYTPFTINASTPPIIAPFFADVDTRGAGSGLTTYGMTTFEGRQAFCVNWPNVGYFAEEMDRTNTFQLLLVERGDVAPGDFDIVFNYSRIDWETGDVSGGVDGLGGTSAGAGYSNGDGMAGDFYQLPGSLQSGALLDSNPVSGLVYNSAGSGVPGRYVFHVTGGTGDHGPGVPSRPWPALGYGYSFANRGMSGYLSPSHLHLNEVLTGADLDRVFTDWSKNAAASGGAALSISHLANFMNNGLCFGLALTGGRFDAEIEPLYDGSGRSDSVWTSAGTGPSASMKLPAPGAGDSTTEYDKQFLGLIGADFLSQLSTQVNGSWQRQHYAFADPISGVARLRAQLEAAMEEGRNLYDYSGRLSGPAGTDFAAITIQIPGFGHEVLAFSAEVHPNGDLAIDVWDNNFPGTYHTIVVQPNGTWTYNAPYPGGTFSREFSLSGAPGKTIGLLAVLPLFEPTGLTYYPAAAGRLGSGTLVDIGPGESLVSAEDSQEAHVDIEPISAGGEGENGSVIDLPSDAGEVTVEGDEPSLDVRGETSYMSGTSGNSSSPVTFSTREANGEIEGSESELELTVARGQRVVRTAGARGLTFDGESVTSTGASGHLQVILEYMKGGSVATANLFEGATTPGATVEFSGAQLAAAEAEPPLLPSSSGNGGSGSNHSEEGTASHKHGTLSIGHSALIAYKGKAKVRLSCTTAGPCAGHLRVIAKVPTASHEKAGHRRTTPKTQVIGQASYSLAAGSTADVSVHLARSAAGLLAQGHQVAVTVLAEPSEGTAGSARLTLKAAAKK